MKKAPLSRGKTCSSCPAAQRQDFRGSNSMNDTELLAHALRRRDEYIKACLASTTSGRRATTIAVLIVVVAVIGILSY
jgi:hypothetical protein